MRTRSTYDPFGWRLNELADPDLNPLRRAQLLDDLIVAEAEELAAGCRHLTIVHREPTDIAEAEALNDFYDAVEVIVERADWSRLAGGVAYLTVTVAGAGRHDSLAAVAEIAHASEWRALDGPYLEFV